MKDVEEVEDVKDRNPRIGPVKWYTDVLVYRQAYRLALEVSRFTGGLPREEQFELARSFGAMPGPCLPTWWKDGRNETQLQISRGIW